ncbi:2-dehydro-3-deoxygalactonokinase [Massilia sp. CCM 8733]|uniref:2-dehydro-3-deoxygalactonokinase n=1 Tax=Massilia mucilaginosa TaxID=2609282 RepID=A0ABX0NKX7_9BURK|nr:2-dehydro-3-deoxygalactonokinase [Massilia mucilaginosa]NHZ87453.1 2-dehydro-3-deoxygalactonokinase [Massilia mucilaginosa]
MHTQLLGIDWGTSNRRAYLVGRDGKCLARHADDQGMLAVGGDFAGSLAALRARMAVADGVPVVMSGMVGSASGWQEVPYLDTRVPLTGLPAHLAPVQGQAGCFIVPGYCTRDGAVDVMRGEETQLLGAVGRGLLDGWVVLPGTHSKWVYLRGGKVDQLVTYMTGELFSMLAAGGTLAALMAGALDDDSAFGAGLQEARRARPLSNALFGVRARVVSKTMAAAQARSFVSGLLIGTEFVAAQGHADGAIDIIGSPLLAARYRSAAAHFGMPARAHDPDEVYLAALAYFFESV